MLFSNGVAQFVCDNATTLPIKAILESADEDDENVVQLSFHFLSSSSICCQCAHATLKELI